MTEKEFIYTLCKLLSEEVSGFTFKVSQENKGYIINVTLPDDVSPYFKILPTYIGVDVIDDMFEVYVKSGNRGYSNFGRVMSPKGVVDQIDEYLTVNFSDILDYMDSPDFYFSSELRDFLNSNSIPCYVIRKGSPSLQVDNPDYPFYYKIDFSEYKGDVLVTVSEVAPVNSDWDEDDKEIYRSELSASTQPKVFSEILALLRKFFL